MADWVERSTGRLRESNDPPLADQAAWLKLPSGDRSRVLAIPEKYRVIDNETIREATTYEKAAIDEQIAADEHAAALARLLVNRDRAKELLDHGDKPLEIAVRASMKVIHAGMAELRTTTGRPTRTWSEVRAAAKQVIDAGQADPEPE